MTNKHDSDAKHPAKADVKDEKPAAKPEAKGSETKEAAPKAKKQELEHGKVYHEGVAEGSDVAHTRMEMDATGEEPKLVFISGSSIGVSDLKAVRKGLDEFEKDVENAK